MSDDKLSDAAKILGREHGTNMAKSVVTSVNITAESAAMIIAGHDDGDPQVMELCPSPLSGEWTDDPTPMRMLDEIANKANLKGYVPISPDEEDDLLEVYEAAYAEGFWDKAIKLCKGMVKGD